MNQLHNGKDKNKEKETVNGPSLKKLYKAIHSKKKRPADTMNCLTRGNLKEILKRIFESVPKLLRILSGKKLTVRVPFGEKNPFYEKKNPFL